MLIEFLQSRLRRDARGVIINFHTLSAPETRRLVGVLGRHFDFIAHDDLAGRIASGARRPFCLLTFDDGFRSNAIETAPELRRMGVPAVFYVTTGFLDSGRPLWFVRLKALRLHGRLPETLDPAVLKQLPIARVEELLDRHVSERRIESLPSEGEQPMTWEHARELASQGFTIGAHAVEHSVLPRETFSRAAALIRDSMAAVSVGTGIPCSTFAFPNGNYTAALCRVATACGAATVMTTEPRWVGNAAQIWRLPRIQLFPRQSRAKVELKLAAALCDGLLANPDGTGRAYRRIEALRHQRLTEPRSSLKAAEGKFS